MRLANSYRGARRNDARDQGGLAEWRDSNRFAIAANGRAKLEERQKLCAEARSAVSLALADHRRPETVISVLHAFWRTHAWKGCGRAHSRIVRDLAA